jgi:hypothetical protein
MHQALVMPEIIEERLKSCVSDLELSGREVKPVGDIIRPDQMQVIVGHGAHTVNN